MATETTIARPAPYIEALGQQYGKDLTALTGKAMPTAGYAPTVAGQDQAQIDAYTRATTAGQGIGAYQPYLTQAGAYSGPSGYQQFMSPYQQDVIDKTLSQYDIQAQKGMAGIGSLAAKSGNLGGGREGVMRSEYQTESDLNRAMLNAQLLQQGFGQAQQGANTAYGQQMQMASAAPGFQGQDIARLGSAGAIQQAQTQATLDAQREANRLAAYEPYERLGYMGAGIGNVLGGMQGQYQTTVQPNQSALQQAMGIIGTGIGAYQTFNPQKSDARLKTDIENIGKSSSGVNIYSFKYKGDDKTYQGVMAQEVPWASIVGNDGYLKVDYSKVDVEFKRLN